MTARRIVITGASGFIGRHLARELGSAASARQDEDVTVALIGRTGPDARWDEPAAIARLVDGADLLVNMAGRSVDCRYDDAHRAEILSSRLETTRAIAAAVRAADSPPPLWVNSSTATIYRHAEDRPMTESTGELGTGFSVDVARAWEEALFEGELPGTRRVALRMAIVLGDGSALVPLARLARFGLGGPQLDGRWPATRARRKAGTYHERRSGGGGQRFSWIHIDDVAGIIRFLEGNPGIDGPVNAAAPMPSDNRTLMRLLRDIVGMPLGLPTPRWMLEIGAAVIRTETELVLKSRWVVPERLTDAGYAFRHPDLEGALRAILGNG